MSESPQLTQITLKRAKLQDARGTEHRPPVRSKLRNEEEASNKGGGGGEEMRPGTEKKSTFKIAGSRGGRERRGPYVSSSSVEKKSGASDVLVDDYEDEREKGGSNKHAS